MKKIVFQIFLIFVGFAFSAQPIYGQKKSKEKKESRVNCWTKANNPMYKLSALENLFLKYCLEGDTAKMSNLISKGIEVNYVNPNGDSPIKNAIASYNIDAVKLVLKQGSQVSFCYKWVGNFEETFTNYYEIVNFDQVLGTGDNQTSTILEKKIEHLKNSLDLVSEKGYQVGKSISEYTLYKILFELKSDNAIKFYDFLKSKGMTTSLASLFQYTWFDNKIVPSDTLFFSEMIKRGAGINTNVEYYDAGGVAMRKIINPPLFNAVVKGDLFTVRWMIEHGANVNEYFGSYNTSSVGGNYNVGGDNKDCTALIIAIKKKNMNMVKLLVEKGANVNQNCRTRNSPLSEAMNQNNNELIEYLIEKGAKN